MAMPSGSALVLVFGVVVLLFGGKKIRNLQKGYSEILNSVKIPTSTNG